MTRSTDPQSGRELPKAYLRLDPDVDQKHPDNLAEFIRLMCASARQRPRGRFANKAVLEALFGRAAVGRFVARGDVEAQPDGSVITAGWSDWQEGDMTVAERVRRTRHKKAEALLDRYTDVTQPFPDPLPIPLPPSTVLTSPVATVGSETVGETVPSGDPPLMEVIHTIERISRRPWSYRPGSARGPPRGGSPQVQTRTGLTTTVFLPANGDRPAVASLWRRHRARVVGIALLSPLSYMLVLAAMRIGPVSHIAPAREVSIVFGAWLGSSVLGEGDRSRRLLASAAFAAGVIALALA